jgi:DNA polymerase
MLIGEQPGNKEDIVGRPFVGRAGDLLNRALAKAGIDRSKIYVTNVVKHFKWVLRGKRRMSQPPRASEINACRLWLDAEIERVKPQVIVCLGAVAAQTLLGKNFRVSTQHGELVDSELAPGVTATMHPASLLRIFDEKKRHQEIDHFMNDIKKAVSLLE